MLNVKIKVVFAMNTIKVSGKKEYFFWLCNEKKC